MLQPKLDGVRCLVKLCLTDASEPVMYSRGRKQFWSGSVLLAHFNESFRALRDTVRDTLPDVDILTLDGELYSADICFQKIVSLSKRQPKNKEEEDEASTLQFHCFDCFWGSDGDVHGAGAKLPFRTRAEYLQKFKEAFGDGHDISSIQFVATELCEGSDQSIQARHRFWADEGYEGVIVRDPGGAYEHQRRSPGLLKHKLFDDDEFEIVGYEQGEGKEVGAVIWACKTATGEQFSARPAETYESRRELYQKAQENPKEFLGKFVTVRYQGKSEEGVPRFPVAVALRDYE